ncbi:MAG: hypothetical protein ACE5GD_05285 [Candidatus Geothermarchaeales archaeon]
MSTVEEKLLVEAERRIFSLGLGDSASILSHINMRYGLAKIIFVLQQRGIDITETFCILGPDATISRNFDRWSSGFGYGCLIQWPNEKYTRVKMIFPEVRPNACGMILALMRDEVISHDNLLRRIHEVKGKELYIGDIPIKWDLGKSNHFIEVLTVKKSKLDELSVGSYAALIHTSASELKERLYLFEDFGDCWLDTSLGRCCVLEGRAAANYYDQYKRLEAFSMEKKRLLLTEIFGDCEIICNPVHQGLFATNKMRLGIYDSMDSSTCTWKTPLFPLALRWDVPVYLMKGIQNLSHDALHYLGFSERVEELGISDFVGNANILPHGGGYELKISHREIREIQTRDLRLFKIATRSGKPLIFSNPREFPYTYRGRKVLRKIQEYVLGEPIAEFRQVCSYKI